MVNWRSRIIGNDEVPPESLLAHPKNWRIHPEKQQKVLTGALNDLGWIQRVIVSKNSGFVIDGHLRVSLAISSGQQSIPVEYVDLSEEEEAEALAILDPIAGMAATDAAQLDALMGEIKDADAAVAEYLAELSEGLVTTLEPEGRTDPDEVPEAPDEPITKRGDVWVLGGHRIMCGDAVSMTDVDALLDGITPEMVYTDPPYGVDIVKGGWIGSGAAYNIPFGGVKNRGSVGASKPFGSKGKRGTDGATNMVRAGIYDAVIGDDSTVTATDAYNLCAGLGIAVLIFWGGNYYASALPDSPGWIVWDKENTGNFADAELAWTNQKRAVRIFKHQWNGMLRASERGEKRVHPTQKPVALAEWCFETYGKPGDRVLDLFAGSGGTLTACERTGRTGYAMELSERYVDIICRRYQEYTSTLPVLESTGEAHDFTAALVTK